MKGQTLDTMASISIIGSLHLFKMVFDNSHIGEGAVLGVLPYVMKMSAATALMTRLSLKSKSSNYSAKENVLTTNCQVMNHLMETYAMDGILAETDSKTARNIKLSTVSPLDSGNGLWIMKLRCPYVHYRNVLWRILVIGVRQYIKTVFHHTVVNKRLYSCRS